MITISKTFVLGNKAMLAAANFAGNASAAAASAAAAGKLTRLDNC
jgi:hypothetical protein